MPDASIENDLVRKVLRSVESRKETTEEIQDKYSKLYPPNFFLRGSPSISQNNLLWALQFLAREGYVEEEVTRYLEHELESDTKVYCLTAKGLALKVKKK